MQIWQKISPIKQRILQFAENLGVSKRDFYAKIDVSRGTLESRTGITEDIMAKFIVTFPNVSLEWLIRGNGPMLRVEPSTPTPIPELPVTPEPPTPTIIYERDPRDIALIAAQEKTIASQGKVIAQFEKLAAAKDEIIERDRLLAAAERKSTLYGRSHVSDTESTALDFAR